MATYALTPTRTAAAAAPRRNAVKLVVPFFLLFLFLIFSVKFLTSIPAVVTNYSPFHLHHMPPDISHNSITKRSFLPVGTGSYLFVALSAYRGGDNTFALIGLGAKSVQFYSPPSFQCHWFPHSPTSSPIITPGFSYTPDKGMGRVYTAYVINCTFPSPVASGGRLVVKETADGGGEPQEQQILALSEPPGAFNTTLLSAPPKYKYLYCSSRLYAGVSPQRLREWIAYHVWLFGANTSHFVFYDNGGLRPGAMAVLSPWMERGLATVHDIRDQTRYDGFNRNQFLFLNDCLFRHRLLAQWIFFFDVDEFIYIDPITTLEGLLQSLSNYTQVKFDQHIMSNTLCASGDKGRTKEMWGFEKLVYTRPPRDKVFNKDHDRKYAVQPRGAMSVGIHESESVDGETYDRSDGRIMYFHYRGSINVRADPCREFGEGDEAGSQGMRFTRDDRLRRLAGDVKDFERSVIGSALEGTLD